MKHKRTRDIVIELTSLLDVVMILIFAVMIKNTQLMEERTAALEEVQEQNGEMQGELEKLAGISEELENALAKLAEGDIEELLARLQNAENQLNAYDYMDDIVVVFNVGLENKYNNTERCLTYGAASDENGGKQISAKRRDPEEWKYAVNTLKLDLQEFIETELASAAEDKYIYIVFIVDESKVYSNDFEDIKRALEIAENKDESGRIQYRLKKSGE